MSDLVAVAYPDLATAERVRGRLHARGFSGTPCSGHFSVAASSASWTASSHGSNRPWRRKSTPSTSGASGRRS